MIDFARELNPIQYEACTNINGPVMVIAGPGSGKTRVLTYRIAYMLEQGIKPWNILALTFTNKAAREMKERLGKLVGPSGLQVWAGTFHSIFAKIMRIESQKIGYPSTFTIYDTEDTKSLIGNLLVEMGFDKAVYTPNMVRNRISSAKSLLISPQAYAANEELLEEDKSRDVPQMYKVYAAYARRCFDSAVMDFDDLLYNFFLLLQRNPDEVLEKYRKKFQYLLVDEFQDTNYLQYAILKKLVRFQGSAENICIVGDDAQSIYAFRGATIDNILNFEKEFSNVGIFKLEQNYRSSKHIINAANNVINFNTKQIQKKIWTDKEESRQIGLIRALTDIEEARKVVDTIFELKNRDHLSSSEIAILYRTNAQSRAFEEHLRRNNMAYRIYGGMSFYQRKEVKDMLAYFRLVVNTRDEEAFRRVINHPKRSLGNTTIDKLIDYARTEKISVWEAMTKPIFPTRTQQQLHEFHQMIETLHAESLTEDAYVLATHIFQRSGLSAMLRADTTLEGKGRLENIQSLLDGIKEYVENDVLDEMPEEEGNEDELPNNLEDKSLRNYLQTIALISDQDVETEENEHISLMSVHAAKGLEFDAVFITGLEENLFPSFMSLSSEHEIDEERRLFFVALTRARKHLTLTYATSRYKFGKMTYFKPSRFLDEVGEDNLATPLHKPQNLVYDNSPRSGVSGHFQKKQTAIPTHDRFEVTPNAAHDFQAGQEVLHPRFGKGKIIRIDGGGDNKVASVRFNLGDDSERRIMLKFAKMQILG
ncbi:MAG TPA: 3'-5' exonuclease [Saprospiraceae bacterium]|nr:3'-5' exonuclease [Saprospiraceae bacterium]HQW55888.1 3'-5' exonuclease [Saprospiraceae bacterium]